MHEFSLWPALLTIAGVMAVTLGLCAFLIYVERKVAAWVQDRVGPNRVGPKGLFQSVADGLKFLLKEDIIPDHVDKVLFLIAPCIALITALLAFAVVPFGATDHPKSDAYRDSYQFVIAPGVDIGIVFIFALTSLAVYAIILGGWSANNKYSLLGGLRSSAQVISYEIPLGLSVLGIIVLSGSLNLEWIIWQQVPSSDHVGVWNIVYQPLAFLIFMCSAFAETNRLPFDLPEAEQELVGGFHTEYSALKMALFFLGEYTHVITTSFLMVIMFFGGWHFPLIAEADAHWLIKLVVFGGKVTVFILFIMMIRWTLPRFRFDQLMSLAWKVLIPLAIVNLVCVMVVKQADLSPLWLLPITLAVLVGSAWLGTLAEPGAPSPRTAIRGEGQHAN
jgi:NADH-quinone oxidoreductase subunit H